MGWLGVAAGVVALGMLLLISRRLILGRWRRHDLTHRQAAALWALATPLILVLLWVIRGIDSLGDLLLLGALVALTFGSKYVVALFSLRVFGGEMDPPSSSEYRRRP